MNALRALDKAGKTLNMIRYIVIPITVLLLLSSGTTYAAGSNGVISEIGYIKALLSQIGPALSAILFIIAGIFYAIGQMLPPDKKANFHTTSINIIIGAIVVAILSVASTALASASSHLLTNMTVANMSS
ncbi:MAG: hypothetical protein M1279_01195 [Candidatus Marsarchaeota archaeon]|jgi:hypothetical protein|nr:hypothetical protein [Candidatus Marsarchaeota archaeon]